MEMNDAGGQSGKYVKDAEGMCCSVDGLCDGKRLVLVNSIDEGQEPKSKAAAPPKCPAPRTQRSPANCSSFREPPRRCDDDVARLAKTTAAILTCAQSTLFDSTRTIIPCQIMQGHKLCAQLAVGSIADSACENWFRMSATGLSDWYHWPTLLINFDDDVSPKPGRLAELISHTWRSVVAGITCPRFQQTIRVFSSMLRIGGRPTFLSCCGGMIP
ncbi:hypothetical protein R6Q59_010008 [Mikania micrantha]